jgi:hypothetical protein
MIAEHEGIPIEHQRLTFIRGECNPLQSGTVLEDDRHIDFYELRSFSSEQLLRLVDTRVAGGDRPKIFIKTLAGYTMAVDFDASDSIAAVKTKIQVRYSACTVACTRLDFRVAPLQLAFSRTS